MASSSKFNPKPAITPSTVEPRPSSSEAETGLVLYDKMRLAIEQCASVDEVKEVRSKAIALALYRRQAGDRDAEKKFAAIRIRAERRIGQLLIEMKQTGERAKAGDRGPSEGRGARPSVEAQTLSDLKITKDESSRCQKLASIPRERFEQALTQAEQVPTTAGVISKTEHAVAPADDGAVNGRNRILANADYKRMIKTLSTISGACSCLHKLRVPLLLNVCKDDEVAALATLTSDSIKDLRLFLKNLKADANSAGGKDNLVAVQIKALIDEIKRIRAAQKFERERTRWSPRQVVITEIMNLIAFIDVELERIYRLTNDELVQ